MLGIKWRDEKRKLKDLIEFSHNPRSITSKQVESLKQSLTKFGLVEPLAINTDNIILGGNQRKKILQLIGSVDPDYEIDVRVPERKLTDAEAKELNIRLNKNVAQWDYDILANQFEVEELTDWGFEKWELGLPEENLETDDIWKGMPEFEQEDLSPVKTIMVHFASIDDMNDFAELVDQKLTEKTKSIWYPEAERLETINMAYSDES